MCFNTPEDAGRVFNPVYLTSLIPVVKPPPGLENDSTVKPESAATVAALEGYLEQFIALKMQSSDQKQSPNLDFVGARIEPRKVLETSTDFEMLWPGHPIPPPPQSVEVDDECPSLGSFSHPFACKQACKYHTKGGRCKDGQSCSHCHLCKWTRLTAEKSKATQCGCDVAPAGRASKKSLSRPDRRDRQQRLVEEKVTDKVYDEFRTPPEKPLSVTKSAARGQRRNGGSGLSCKASNGGDVETSRKSRARAPLRMSGSVSSQTSRTRKATNAPLPPGRVSEDRM